MIGILYSRNRFGSASLPSESTPGKDTSLKCIERPPTVTIKISNNEFGVNDHIVIENEKKITLCGGKPSVESASFAFTLLRKYRKTNVARSSALLC